MPALGVDNAPGAVAAARAQGAAVLARSVFDRDRARLERGSEVGGWCPWAVVGPDALPALARASGLVHRAIRQVDGRPFGLLARPLHAAA